MASVTEDDTSTVVDIHPSSEPEPTRINTTKDSETTTSRSRSNPAQISSSQQRPQQQQQKSVPQFKLGYTVQTIAIGVIAAPTTDSSTHAVTVAREFVRMGPDRFRVQVFRTTTTSGKTTRDDDGGGISTMDDDGEAGNGNTTSTTTTSSWPKVDILVVCCSKPNFPSLETQRYVSKNQPLMVLTDFDLNRTLSDRRYFYELLDTGGLLSSRLPRRAYASRDKGEDDGPKKDPKKKKSFDDVVDIQNRRDQIEVNGTILLKPVLERSTDPNEEEIRVYYPKRKGGGCKILSFDASCASVDTLQEPPRGKATFEPEINEVRRDSGKSFIYEELLEETQTKDEEGDGAQRQQPVLERKYTKRDRLKSFAFRMVPGMERRLIRNTSVTTYDDDDDIEYDTDLTRLDRNITIVTTATLPWMTGTAVNPLLRAAYLCRGRPKGAVTLVVPWLEREDDRKELYGTKNVFATMVEQEMYIRDWLKERAGMVEEADPENGIRIMFYPSRYHNDLGSIFAMGDICKLIPDENADVCILEEPEHLNWFRASGDAWTAKFKHVVGIIHTNYKAYAASTKAGVIAAPVISGMSTLMVRAYCNKVIKLSAVLQTFAPEKEVVCNVHGVRSDFLEEGKRRADAYNESPQERQSQKSDEKPCVYFIGKMLWAKGLDRLLHLEDFFKECTGEYIPIDIIGDGPDMEDIKKAYYDRTSTGSRGKIMKRLASSIPSSNTSSNDLENMPQSVMKSDVVDTTNSRPGSSESETTKKLCTELQNTMHDGNKEPIPAHFLGRKDHALLTDQYKVLVNPSITEVLCTTTAEALAMGKFVIIPVHPSNDFFEQFPNCLSYHNKLEFVSNISWALTHEPEPLSEELSYQFTWEAATERLILASAITMREGRERAKAQKFKVDERIAYFYNKVGEGPRGDVLRKVLGGGPVADQTEYEKSRRVDDYGSSNNYSGEGSPNLPSEEEGNGQQTST